MSAAGFETARQGVRPASGAAGFRHLLFAAILLAFWISTKPFGAMLPGEAASEGGNIANQITFATLAAASALALRTVDIRVLRPFMQPSYALLGLWLLVSALLSAEAGDALRALALTMITAFLGAVLYALPDSIVRFRTLLVLCVGACLALSWAGVIVMPDVAIHTDDDPVEPEHAGSWRGHLMHKNIAGAMMAVFAIVGVYAFRGGLRLQGLAITVGAVAFLYFTKSKTSFMLFPVVMAISFAVERMRPGLLRAALCVGPIAALNLLTLGSALSPAIAAFNKSALRDPTFTGRLDIWRFGFAKLAETPWTGFGFESFWKSDAIVRMEANLELSWMVQNSIHGHNSYLDVALGTGLIGLALTVWVFIVKPVRDFNACQRDRENSLLASCCMTIWLFISLCMCLEVFYFRRVDPIWFTLVLAVAGLRMMASYRLGAPSDR